MPCYTAGSTNESEGVHIGVLTDEMFPKEETLLYGEGCYTRLMESEFRSGSAGVDNEANSS